MRWLLPANVGLWKLILTFNTPSIRNANLGAVCIDILIDYCMETRVRSQVDHVGFIMYQRPLGNQSHSNFLYYYCMSPIHHTQPLMLGGRGAVNTHWNYPD